MSGLWSDLRFAVRQVRAQPGFALAAILSLGLGVGLNAAVFSVVDGVLLRRSPVAEPGRVMMVWETDRTSGTTREPASLPDYLDFRDRTRTFQSLAAVMAGEANLTPLTGDPVRLASLDVTSSFLPLIGVEPRLGRSFTAADEAAGAAPVALVSEALWARLFDRRPDVVGQTLRLDGVPHEIVGVVPDRSDFGVLQMLGAAAYARSFADRGVRVRVEVWAPLVPDVAALPRSTHPIFVLGRLAPGATPAAADAELAAVATELERAFPENAGRGVFIEPLDAVVFGPVRPALLALWAAVGLVLLVACVNVANLLLARGTARSREFAIRIALGSGGLRLARQLVVETCVLTFAGALVGVAVAYSVLGILVARAPANLPRIETVAIDLRVLGLTALVTLVAGLVFGLVPAWQARGIDPQGSLKAEAGGRATGGRAASRTRAALVVAEVALTVVLVTGAALLIQTLWRIQHIDPGFAAAGVLKAEYQLPASRYPANFRVFPDFKENHAFTRGLLERARAIPGVTAVAVTGNHPLDPGFTNSFRIVGRDDERHPEISIRRVSPGYFDTVGLALESGRLLADTDTTAGPAVVLINSAARARLFADRNPLGAQLSFWGTGRTVVGVVEDEHFQGVTTAVPIAVYAPLSQAPADTGVLLLRTTLPPATLAPSAIRAIHEGDPQLAVFGIEPLTETVARSIGEQRFATLLLGVFAVMALVLAAVGVHGVLSYSVARRTRELGIRMALGAAPARLRRSVVVDGLGLALLGLVVGLVGAAGLTRALGSLLYGVTPTDPLTFVVVSLVLLAVAAAASVLPARRATAIDPTEALRGEA